MLAIREARKRFAFVVAELATDRPNITGAILSKKHRTDKESSHEHRI